MIQILTNNESNKRELRDGRSACDGWDRIRDRAWKILKAGYTDRLFKSIKRERVEYDRVLIKELAKRTVMIGSESSEIAS